MPPAAGAGAGGADDHAAAGSGGGGAPLFRALAALAREHGLAGLSMGSTQDFETAIEEGATVVRVGTAVFGERPRSGSSLRREPRPSSVMRTLYSVPQ